jgi:Ca-activated chloride channel family protein
VKLVRSRKKLSSLLLMQAPVVRATRTCGRRLLAALAIPLLLAAGPDPSKLNEKAMAAYEAGEYDEALQSFTDALVDAPESPELHFNIGTAEYQLEHYDEALDQFRSVLPSGKKDLIASAHYNMGNCLYRQAEKDILQGRGEEVIQKYESAVKSYIEALKINPDDVQAKYNIEFIRRKIKEMLDQQAAQQQQQQQQEQQQENQQGDESQQDQSDQEKQDTSAAQGTPTPQTSDQSEAQPPENQPTPFYMTPEEAERLLESLDEEKREEMEEQMRRLRQGAGVEADW